MTSKNFTLTIYDFEEKSNLQHESVRYSAYAEETCPTTGRKHLQAFVIFKSNKRCSGVKKLFPTSHIEIMHGSFFQNVTYCSKETQLIEYGEKPMDQQEKGKRGAEYWEEQKRFAETDLEKVDPILLFKCPMGVKFIRENFIKKQKVEKLESTCGYWYYGQAGTGKTTKAREEHPDAYNKDLTKWWDGYNGQEVVIMDDMDPFHKHLSKYLKDWADKWPFQAEKKGSVQLIRPKKFIVTSQYHYNRIFEDQETLEALDRRFTLVPFPVPSADVEVRGLVPRT